MSRFLLLYVTTDSGGIGTDPVTLTPTEHYKEDDWTAGPTWTDNVASTKTWDTSAGVITAGTQNSLTVYEGDGAAGTKLGTTSTPKAIQWLQTDDWITLYIVMKIQTSLNKYVLAFAGAVTRFFWLISDADGKLAVSSRNNTGNTLSVLSGVINDNAFRVYAIRLKNVDGDGVLDVWVNSTKLTGDTDAGYNSNEVGTGAQNLYNNPGATASADVSFGELIMFKAEHSDEVIGNVIDFLGDKWGITV